MKTTKIESILDAIAEHNRLMTSYLYSFQTDTDAARENARKLNRYVEHLMNDLGFEYKEILWLEEKILQTA